MVIRDRTQILDPDEGHIDQPTHPPRSHDLIVGWRTCTHCGAFSWFAPEDLAGSWYRCGRCGTTA
jgi:hypothetical protein